MSDLDVLKQLRMADERLRITEVKEVPHFSSSTWTPTYLGNTTPGVTTYSLQQGTWVRIGNLVIVTGTVVWTAATGTGNANFGLPFTAQNVSNQFFSGSVRVDSVTFANSAPQVVISPNTAFFNLVS